MGDHRREITRIMTEKYHHNLNVFEPTFVTEMINKRMTSLKFTRFSEYQYYLDSNQDEAMMLNNSLLIHFSEFFRDNTIYSVLEKSILPEIISRIKQGESIRIWSTSCSTGEEAYSLAILINQRLINSDDGYNVNIFATDIDNEVLDKARIGAYEHVNIKQVPTYVYYIRHR